MPYINPEDRDTYDDALKSLIDDLVHSGENWRGELNYFISSVLSALIDEWDGPRYAQINDMIGVLECIKLELYRRVAAPYEDLKADENGDVY